MAAPQPAEAPRRWERWEVLALAALLALALGLRVAHVLGSRASPLFDAPQMDALYHVEWARAFAAGERFQPPPFFRAPLYPWFLGTLLRLFGDGLLLPRLVQSGLGTLSTLLVYLIARRAFGRPQALVAGLLWACQWVGIFYDGELLLETLAIPLYLFGIWLSLGLAQRPSAPRCVGAGVVWGLSAITRPNVLLLMPLLALWLLLRERRRGLRALVAPAALTVGTLLPILPITAYNAWAGGDLVLIASQAGVNLWIGNNPVSDGSTAVVPGTREDWWGGWEDAIREAELAEGRPLRPSEVSRYYSRRALAFVRTQPLAWLGLMARKLRLLTWNIELANNEEPRALFETFSPLAFLTPYGFFVLFSCGLLGLAVTARSAWSRLPLWGFLLAYALSVVTFFVNARFRLPLLPPLAVYSGAGIVWLGQAARARRLLPLAAALLALVGLAAFSLAIPEHVLRRSRSNGHLMLGTAAAVAQEWQAAAAELEQAVAIEPGNSIAWRVLGTARRKRGDPVGAEQAFRRGLEVRGDDAEALNLLVDLLIEQGRAPEAAALARRLTAVEPSTGRGPYAEGRILFAAGDVVRAAQAFRTALERQPEHFGARYALGLCLLAQGEHASAAEQLELALDHSWTPEQRPFALDAWRLAVETWLALGLRDRARAAYDRRLDEFGSEPLASQLRDRL